MSTKLPYIHGFSPEEQNRLRVQASFMEPHIYDGLTLKDYNNMLEVGCGVGAQTEIILRRYPKIHVTGIDLNDRQIEAAKPHLASLDFAKDRYEIVKMSADKMSFVADRFDCAFVAWVLEHVPDPCQVLKEVRRVLKPGGLVILNEVMNYTFFLDPYSPCVWRYWMAFNDLQWEQEGDPFVGGKLGHYLNAAGFTDIVTTPKNMHFDSRHPKNRKEALVEWKDLCMSAKDELISAGKVDEELVEKVEKEFDHVIQDSKGIFYSTFMQATARA